MGTTAYDSATANFPGCVGIRPAHAGKATVAAVSEIVPASRSELVRIEGRGFDPSQKLPVPGPNPEESAVVIGHS